MKKISQEIIGFCKRLNEKNCLAAADGNLSVRISDKNILITPSGRNKAFIAEKEIAKITLDNLVVKGTPSSERLMHLAVYRACREAKAVVHAHPPLAIAWSIARPKDQFLPMDSISELILALGKVPIVPYARPGTEDMGKVLLPFLPDCRVMILARHGAISWGESLEEAYNGIERLEHSVSILKSALDMGGLSSLPRSELTVLQEMRKKLGNRIL